MTSAHSPFRFPYVVGLHDSDAAGIIFSANLIRICHEAYSAWMEQIGFGIGTLLKRRPFGIPIVHIEGDFLFPLFVGDRVEIRLCVDRLGTSSYRIAYELYTADERKAATANTVHVCVDVKGHRPLDLPADFRSELEKFRK